MITWIAAASCFLAVIPAALFLRNLSLYAPLPRRSADRARAGPCSFPRATKNAISARRSARFCGANTSISKSSCSTTARPIAPPRSSREIAQSDPRVRLETAAPLPAGWCGKNFACHQLAQLARHPLLVFMDADVRISRPDSLARLAEFIEQSGAALVSGVPREETRGLMEKLIIPLIHFVLLGFLPLRRMRSRNRPAFRRRLRTNPRRPPRRLRTRRWPRRHRQSHPRRRRAHPHIPRRTVSRPISSTARTPSTAACISRASEVWHGFAKNAHEGLGSAAAHLPSDAALVWRPSAALRPPRLRAVAARAHRGHRRHTSRASSPSPASANRFSARCCTRSAFACSSRFSGSHFSAASAAARRSGKAAPIRRSTRHETRAPRISRPPDRRSRAAGGEAQ